MTNNKSKKIISVAILNCVIIAISSCADLNSGGFSYPQSQYPSNSGGYGNSGGAYGNNYPSSQYDYEYERRRRHEEQLEYEREQIERERDRLEDERRQIERQQRYQENIRNIPPLHTQPPAQQAPSGCSAGFYPSDKKCTDKERKSGCKDMRASSGQLCVKGR